MTPEEQKFYEDFFDKHFKEQSIFKEVFEIADPGYLEKAMKHTKAIQDSDQEALESITRKILLEDMNEEAEKNGEEL